MVPEGLGLLPDPRHWSFMPVTDSILEHIMHTASFNSLHDDELLTNHRHARHDLRCRNVERGSVQKPRCLGTHLRATADRLMTVGLEIW